MENKEIRPRYGFELCNSDDGSFRLNGVEVWLRGRKDETSEEYTGSWEWDPVADMDETYLAGLWDGGATFARPIEKPGYRLVPIETRGDELLSINLITSPSMILLNTEVWTVRSVYERFGLSCFEPIPKPAEPELPPTHELADSQDALTTDFLCRHPKYQPDWEPVLPTTVDAPRVWLRNEGWIFAKPVGPKLPDDSRIAKLEAEVTRLKGVIMDTLQIFECGTHTDSYAVHLMAEKLESEVESWEPSEPVEPQVPQPDRIKAPEAEVARLKDETNACACVVCQELKRERWSPSEPVAEIPPGKTVGFSGQLVQKPDMQVCWEEEQALREEEATIQNSRIVQSDAEAKKEEWEVVHEAKFPNTDQFQSMGFGQIDGSQKWVKECLPDMIVVRWYRKAK